MQKNRTVSNFKNLQTLPSLSLTHSKLFENKDDLMKTKKLLLERLSEKQANADNQNQGLRPMKRSFIQFPRNQNETMGLMSFDKINRSQSQKMLSQFPKLRSSSTQLRKTFIKTEIVYNNFQAEKIQKMLSQKQTKEQELVRKRIKQLTPHKMKKQVKIKPKFKNKSKNVLTITLTMDYSVYERNLYIWKPFLDFDVMPIFLDTQVYFIGGRKRDASLVSYSISEDKWRQLPPIKGIKSFGQCPHTILSNGQVFLFGGYNYFQQGFTLISNSLKIIDFAQKEFRELEFPENKVPPRAFHHQCLYGKYLIISGGLNKDSKCFNNFMTYQIDKNFWSQLTINQKPGELALGFAKHQTISVFHKRKVYSIYNTEQITQIDPDIKEEGIYIYGGQNSQGELLSKIFIMKLGSPSVNIIEPIVKGAPPLPRRNMKMIRHKSYLIMHGGRNDQMTPFVLNSMHFFNLKNLNWIQVKGQKPPYRYSHTMGVINNDIIILGGKTHEGLSKQIFIMPYQEISQYK